MKNTSKNKYFLPTRRVGVAVLCCGFAFMLWHCDSKEKQKNVKDTTSIAPQCVIVTPAFDADTAYHFVEQQVSFGARVPNTKAHVACAKYLLETLKRFSDTVVVQPFETKAYNGTTLKGQNIIGSFNPQSHKRILLCAHWDSRPYADHDPNPDNHRQAVDGANDGASGVGVLLELARQLQIDRPTIGVDIIFFDAEDYGAPEGERAQNDVDSWCLGSLYWSQKPHRPNYRAQYGILLDMVGASNATFTKEKISMYFASDYMNNIWAKAQAMGYGSYFQNRETSEIIDDHLNINRYLNIPTIDVIDRRTETGSGFYPHWHTREDNMEKIDKKTLEAVGKVVLFTVKSEK